MNDEERVEQVTTGLHETPAGVADAERLAAAVRATPAKPRSARPAGKKAGKPIRPRPAPAGEGLEGPGEPAVSPKAASEQLLEVSRSLAAVRSGRLTAQEELTPEEKLERAYTMSEPLAMAAGEAAAAVQNTYLPVDPRWRLALVLAPYLFGILVAELAYYQHRRATRGAAPRRERDALRPEGVRKDDAGEIVIGAPFSMPDR